MGERWTYRTHTSGNDREVGFYIFDGKNQEVCRLHPTSPKHSPATAKRNARVIAAAPLMLEALKEVLDKGANEKTMRFAREAVDFAEKGNQPVKPASSSSAAKREPT